MNDPNKMKRFIVPVMLTCILLLLFGCTGKATPAAAATAPSIATTAATPVVRDDLTLIRGIGATYASRLYAAGITTYAALAQLTPAQIKAIVNPSRAGNFIDAEGWIAQAQLLAQGKP